MSGEVKHVYTAINEVTARMAREGISKSRKNTQQNYSFRGIDDAYNVLAPILAEVKLLMLPRVKARTVTERPTKTGGVSTYVVLDVDFDFVSAVDGSMHTVSTMGEAMDTADKATNKAMSAAQKYAMFMAFQIPTEGDNDTENHHHEKAPAGPPPNAKASDPGPEELAIAAMFHAAMNAEGLAQAEIAAKKAIDAKKVQNGGRARLLLLRKETLERLGVPT